MAEQVMRFSDGKTERYDDRFVCRWHIQWDDDGLPTGMTWCGLDCPVQRELLARDLTPTYVPNPAWDALAASNQEADADV